MMVLLAIPLTIVVYRGALLLSRRVGWAVLNPVLVSMAVLIGCFAVFRSQLPAYQQGSAPLAWLLQPTVVALAFPLYRQLPKVREHFRAIALATVVGMLTSLVVGTPVALLAGASRQMAASLAPKAVTTPVAMAISSSIGGVPSITAVSVIFAGILGASFGFAVLERFGIRGDATIGLAMGSASHALGTARCSECNQVRGAFSSLAMVVCAVVTSVLTPIVVPWLLRVFGA